MHYTYIHVYIQYSKIIQCFTSKCQEIGITQHYFHQVESGGFQWHLPPVDAVVQKGSYVPVCTSTLIYFLGVHHFCGSKRVPGSLVGPYIHSDGILKPTGYPPDTHRIPTGYPPDTHQIPPQEIAMPSDFSSGKGGGIIVILP